MPVSRCKQAVLQVENISNVMDAMYQSIVQTMTAPMTRRHGHAVKKKSWKAKYTNRDPDKFVVT